MTTENENWDRETGGLISFSFLMLESEEGVSIKSTFVTS